VGTLSGSSEKVRYAVLTVTVLGVALPSLEISRIPESSLRNVHDPPAHSDTLLHIPAADKIPSRTGMPPSLPALVTLHTGISAPAQYGIDNAKLHAMLL
jgi:hypothetical protein